MICLSFVLMHALSTVSFALQVIDGTQRPQFETHHLPDHPLRFGAINKSMHVQGHTVSQVSRRWGGHVVYAVFTSKATLFHDKLLTQLETWAERPASEGRYVAVGGNDYPESWLQNGTVLKSACSDSWDGMSCKEATLLAEGAARGPAWLVITGEDNFINTRILEEVLQEKDPDEIVAYGCPGCGARNKDNCPNNEEFYRRGGLCGGCGYILSRATLQLLLEDGAHVLHARYDAATTPNDVTTGCMLREKSVRLAYLTGLNGGPITSESDLLQYVDHGFLTMHYVRPWVMRWLHAVVEHKESDVIERLESQAFDRGCAIGMNVSFWMNQWDACIDEWEKKKVLPPPEALPQA